MGASNAKVGIFDPETEEEAVVDNGALHVIVDSGGGTTGGATEATLAKLIPSLDMEAGGKLAIGITATEVTFTGTPKSIIITAGSANTGELYVGESNVTSAGANALTFLLPGESLSMDYTDTTNAVYVVASVAAQNFYKGALL